MLAASPRLPTDECWFAVLEEISPALSPVVGGDERLLKCGLEFESIGKCLP
jgi:hypothetical protein